MIQERSRKIHAFLWDPAAFSVTIYTTLVKRTEKIGLRSLRNTDRGQNSSVRVSVIPPVMSNAKPKERKICEMLLSQSIVRRVNLNATS